MSDKARRKDLLNQYRRSGPEAAVYRIVNTRSGKALLGSTPNLGSVRGKLDFARATGSASVLDRRLHAAAAFDFGDLAFDFIKGTTHPRELLQLNSHLAQGA